MTKKINYDEITILYEKNMAASEKGNAQRPNKHKKLIAYMLDWNECFNEIEKKVWGDIRSIGASLYPKYPVDKYFIAFGNPFLKIGINIEYSNSQFDDSKKLEKLKELDWTVYTVKSKNTYYSAESYYNYITENEVRFDEVPNEERDRFIEDHHLKNSECLIYYLCKKYFSSDSLDEDK